MVTSKPQPSEYAPYYGKYIALVPGDDVVNALRVQMKRTNELLGSRSEPDGNFRYAADKWSVKEVLGHLADAERIFTYRALRIGRADQTPIEGFEQDDYVRSGGFDGRSLKNVLGEFSAVRAATVALYESLAEEAWARRGIANKNEVSVRALAFITAGHELHHVKILEECYFPLRQHA